MMVVAVIHLTASHNFQVIFEVTSPLSVGKSRGVMASRSKVTVSKAHKLSSRKSVVAWAARN